MRKTILLGLIFFGLLAISPNLVAADAPPTIMIDAPDSGTSGQSITITITASDDVDVKSIYYIINYDTLWDWEEPYACPGIQTTCTLTLEQTYDVGINTELGVVAKAEDSAGQGSTIEMAAYIIHPIADPHPTVTITAPSSAMVGYPVTLSATATSAHWDTTIQALHFDNGAYGLDVIRCSGTSCTYTDTVTYLAPGIYTLQSKAMNRYGLWSEVVSKQITVIPTNCMDIDKDGYGTGTDLSQCPASTTLADCLDEDRLIHPGAIELCNSMDDNCNGQITDENTFCPLFTYYLDSDLDGDFSTTISSCQSFNCRPAKYRDVAGTDCNDANADINPSKLEIAGNDLDENCDGMVDKGGGVTYDSLEKQIEVSASNLANLAAAEIIKSVSADDNLRATAGITFDEKTQITVGNHIISVPGKTTFAAPKTADFTKLTASTSVDVSELPSTVQSIGAVKFGLPSTSLTLDKPITIKLFVGPKYEGKTLKVYHKSYNQDWEQLTTCTVLNNYCWFSTTSLSDFAATTSRVTTPSQHQNGGGGASSSSSVFAPDTTTQPEEIEELIEGGEELTLALTPPSLPVEPQPAEASPLCLWLVLAGAMFMLVVIFIGLLLITRS